MTQIPRPKQKGDRRSENRKPVNLPGRLIHESGEADCTVFDISPHGAHVSATPALPAQGAVRLKLTRHGEFLGRIAWRRDGHLGIAFHKVGEERIDLPLEGGQGEASLDAMIQRFRLTT